MGARTWIVLSLAVATLATYSGIVGHDFVNYDDRVYILENPTLREPLSVQSLARAFLPYHDNWIPLTWISLHVDFALFGPEPLAFLRTNLLLHTASTILLFLAFTRLTGAPWRSAFVAAVFALHPLHVESVAWASERKDALAGFFWMLTLFVYAGRANALRSHVRYAMLLLSFSAGLLAKPVVVTLPAALLLLDYWPLGRLSRPAERRLALLEKLPLLALSVLAGIVTLSVQRSARAMFFADQLPFEARVANALESTIAYLGASFWPSHLAAFYPYPLEGFSAPWVSFCALLMLAISALCVYLSKTAPCGIVGWSWFLITLLPTLGLVQVGLQASADRYMYLPLVGIAMAIAWGAADLTAGRRNARRVAAGAGALACIALAIGSSFQLRYWRNTLALFERAAAVTSRNYYAHNAIGGVHLEAGRFEEAEDHYREALRFAPGWVRPQIGLANIHMARGEAERAISAYRAALEQDPDHPIAHFQLGVVLLAKGRIQQALQHLERARDLGDKSAELAASMGVALARSGRPSAAVGQLRVALELDPAMPMAELELAWLLATSADTSLRDPSEALRIAERLAGGERASTPRVRVLDVLAAAEAASGRFELAAKTAAIAAQIARERGMVALARAVEQRRRLYERGRPFIAEAE